jgi:hypothetical protein
MYSRRTVAATFNYDVWAQSLSNGATSGAAFAVANVTTRREMTPNIACGATTTCVTPYRWFDPGDTLTDADRIKAKVITYP